MRCSYIIAKAYRNSAINQVLRQVDGALLRQVNNARQVDGALLRQVIDVMQVASSFNNAGRVVNAGQVVISDTGERRMNAQDWDLIEQIKQLVQNLPDLEVPPASCYIILEVDGCMEGWGGRRLT